MKRQSLMVPLLALALGLAVAAGAEEISLYPTGPSQDSSFLRFVDATVGAIKVVSAAGRVSLTPAQPATAFLSVPAKWQVKGQIESAGRPVQVDLHVRAGEFASVVVLSDQRGALVTQVLREQPNDFNALKASVGFANLAGTRCADAALKVAGSTVNLFEHSTPMLLQRRLVNPVQLAVQLVCAGKQSGMALKVGALAAGERYSVLAVPDGHVGTRLLSLHDRLAR